MSRKARRTKQAILERANYSTGRNYGPQGIQGNPYGGAAMGNTITLPASVFTTMLQNLAPQKNQAQDFAPGSPLRPYQGVVPLGGPRQWSYIVGSNLNPNDRTLGNQDIPSFAQLRTFAQLYEGVGLCERVILDMIPKLTPKVVLRKDLAEEGMKETDYQSEIGRWQKFVEMPSPAQQLDIHSWLRMAYTEQTQIDALALFKHMTKGKQLFGLEIISGDSVKPLLDERGMIPQPPFPAYQQYPYGVPGDQYTLEQLLYYRESPRAFTPYGFSRIERIIMRVNQALRKEQKDLARFTEGNLPAGIMEVPDTSLWTPDQIDTYEQAWNSLLAGNQQQQVRVKFTQPGMKYTQFQDVINSQHVTEFDEFLLNVCVASYGLSMGDIGFTEDIHKSSGDSQQNMMYRRTLAPLIEVYAYLFTRILSDLFHDERFVVTFDGFTEQEDLQTQASAYSQFATVGAISPAGIARIMKFPDVPETGPFLLPKGGQPLFLEDMANPAFRKAQQDATMAGLQMAANPQQQGGDEEEQEDDGSEPGSKSNVQQSTKKPSSSTAKSSTSKEEPSQRMVSRVAEMLERVEETLRQIRAENVTPVQRRPEILQHHTGMMLAFMLDPETAKQLALPGGEPASDLHVTLAFLGDMEEEPQDTLLRPHTSPYKIRAAIPAITSEAKPLTGHVTGVGRFNPAETDEAALIALADVPGLTEFRTALVKRVQEAGYFVATNHGYTAHITLQYLNANEDMPIESVPALPLVFDTLCLAVGDDRYYFKLGDEQYPQEEPPHEQKPSTETEATTRVGDRGTDGIDRGTGEVATTSTDAGPARAGTAGTDSPVNPKAISNEYRRWYTRAKDDVKAGRAQRGFTTTLIPEDIHTRISKALARCTTVEEVRNVFRYNENHGPDGKFAEGGGGTTSSGGGSGGGSSEGGGSGGSEGGGSSKSSAERMQALEQHMSAKYPGTVFDLKGGDPAVMEPSMQELDHLFTKYPGVAKTVPYVGTGENIPAIMQRYGYNINMVPGNAAAIASNAVLSNGKAFTPLFLNTKYFGDSTLFNESMQHLSAQGWFAAGSNIGPNYIVAHEFGHAMNFYLEQNGQRQTFLGSSYLGSTISNATKQFMQDNSSIGNDVSQYAAKNTREQFAEAFASMWTSAPSGWAAYTQRLNQFLGQAYSSS